MTAHSTPIQTLFEDRLLESRAAHLCDGQQLSRLMGLSKTQFKKAFAAIIHAARIQPANISPTSIIQVADLPDVSDLRKGYEPLLSGVRPAGTLNLFTLLDTAWRQEDHRGMLLRHLVSAWRENYHIMSKFTVGPDDRIHGHHGFATLKWIEQNWMRIPRNVRSRLAHVALYGWADVSLGPRGVMIPVLSKMGQDFSTPPTVGWYFLSEIEAVLPRHRKDCFGIRG